MKGSIELKELDQGNSEQGYEFLPTYWKVLRLLNRPTVNVDEVADAIERDEDIVSVILQFANSAYYSFAIKITNLRQAIILMGYDIIADIVFRIDSGRHQAQSNSDEPVVILES